MRSRNRESMSTIHGVKGKQQCTILPFHHSIELVEFTFCLCNETKSRFLTMFLSERDREREWEKERKSGVKKKEEKCLLCLANVVPAHRICFVVFFFFILLFVLSLVSTALRTSFSFSAWFSFVFPKTDTVTIFFWFVDFVFRTFFRSCFFSYLLFYYYCLLYGLISKHVYVGLLLSNFHLLLKPVNISIWHIDEHQVTFNTIFSTEYHLQFGWTRLT